MHTNQVVLITVVLAILFVLIVYYGYRVWRHDMYRTVFIHLQLLTNILYAKHEMLYVLKQQIDDWGGITRPWSNEEYPPASLGHLADELHQLSQDIQQLKLETHDVIEELNRLIRSRTEAGTVEISAASDLIQHATDLCQQNSNFTVKSI